MQEANVLRARVREVLMSTADSGHADQSIVYQVLVLRTPPESAKDEMQSYHV
jgi:hypothetical protein